jgi:poly-gamma-glutamate synthesis protein (capsule biosynthesis protein)
VQRIDAALQERMTYSWRRGCPVPLRDLRYVRLSHIGFDGAAHEGELVVHEDVATNLVGVFERLYELRFPIRRMRLVDDYGGSDARSMRKNNTSAFNCRTVTGGTSWSEHSYGRAVDINPVQNPYVHRGEVQPAKGEAYVDRSPLRKGMVTRAVRKAFRAIGWSWGGDWTTRKDYQHFSQTGR